MKKVFIAMTISAIIGVIVIWVALGCTVPSENVGADGRTAHTEKLVDVTVIVHTDPPMSFDYTWKLVEDTYDNENCTSICRQIYGKVDVSDVHFPETKLK